MQKIIEYLKENQPRFIEELCQYVRFPSVSAQPEHRNDMKNCAEWLIQHCRKIGLETQLCLTRGHPIVLAKTPRSKSQKKPHFVVYGHYDVQPAEPFNLWKTPPFEPRIEGRSLVGRGASDNKGQNFAHLKAVEAYLKTGAELPCDLTFVIEGEEEVGSESLGTFLKEHRAQLQCEAVVISDNGIPGIKHPALTYGLRGIIALEIIVTGPNRDLHSGLFGGSVDNPAIVLCEILTRLRDKNGRITIPKFYDDVIPLSAYERKQAAKVPFSENSYKKFLGVSHLFGEKGYTSRERYSARPTFEINGLTSGYQGAGSKTIVPSKASAKLTFRLVSNQHPPTIRKLVKQHLLCLAPPSVTISFIDGHDGYPYLISPKSPLAQASLRALKDSFHAEPLLTREGGTISIVHDFKTVLGADSLMLGLSLPDDNAHSPNEKFSLDCFEKGMRMSAYLWNELSAVSQRKI